MKTLLIRHAILLLLSLLTVMSVTFSIAAPVYAQKDGPGNSGENQGQGQGQGEGQGQEKALLKTFERLYTWLEIQKKQIIKAHEIAARIEEWITIRKANGHDEQAVETGLESYNKQIDDLENSLSEFRKQIAEAEANYNFALASLATHYGIDKSGNVYSVKSARQMIRDVIKSLNESHRLLVHSVQMMHKTVKEIQQNEK